jgi:hypothetical protein
MVKTVPSGQGINRVISMRNNRICLLTILLLISVSACKDKQQKKTQPVANAPSEIQTPFFNADSAYYFVKAQCDFGPRVSGTKEAVRCGDYLYSFLLQYCDTVHVQLAKVSAYNGTVLPIRNFIGQFNTQAKKRLLLFAHWDTRPWADRDSERKNDPILGADDGASGVGVLLEIARILSNNNPAIGVDIAFFDAEDYGNKSDEPDVEDSYALGTQYWCKNPVPKDYRADNGILLDMVGARNAQFMLEGYSKQYANSLLTTVWSTASQLGFGNYFVFLDGGYITDDHLYVNKLAGIPSIDIIHTSLSSPNGFAPHWHTHNDNMEVIDKNTLKAVGQTLLEVIYRKEAI